MFAIKVFKKSMLIGFGTLIFFITALCLLLWPTPDKELATIGQSEEPDWDNVLGSMFELRNSCVLSGDADTLRTIFMTEERKGQWAYESEAARSKYLESWSAKQGVTFLNIHSDIQILRHKAVGRGYAFYLIASSEYTFAYDDDPQMVNTFRLGAYHSLDLIPGSAAGTWVISREWYDDPLAKKFDADIYTEEMTEYIQNKAPADLSGLSDARRSAVLYADTYCGAASDGSNGYKYNPEYTDYNALGGNCANFASQVLFEGGGFKKNSTWNYKDGKGSRAWINAQGFKDYLIYNGRGSLIAHGKYKDIYKAVYELRPGDIIAYAFKGDVTHISVVTGQDSKGYPLVNSHNLDRYRVPWDIGWNTNGYSFYLIRVAY
jgi:hypothetical protein